jgi:hypothetical protein
LVGSYGLSLNGTLANATFAVGLTNSTQYHRGDTVNIKAAYAPSEIVTVTISGKDIPSDIANVSADLAGIASYNWTVPTYAPIGSYALDEIGQRHVGFERAIKSRRIEPHTLRRLD